MIDVLYGLWVEDEAGYAAYRAAMSPLLANHGGSFGMDARVSELLKPTDGVAVNRVFTIRFPSERELDGFFADPEYLVIRKRLFEPAVSRTHRFGKYSVLE